MNVKQVSRSISITLADYIFAAAASSEVPLHGQIHTPLSPSTNFQDEYSLPLEDVTPYQAIVGQLLFIAYTSHPDIAYSMSLLSRFPPSSSIGTPPCSSPCIPVPVYHPHSQACVSFRISSPGCHLLRCFARLCNRYPLRYMGSIVQMAGGT